MAALLLDTHAMVWLLGGERMEVGALYAIAQAQAEATLFVSPITAWEAALAADKGDVAKRPDLGGADAATWFRRRKRIGARLATITLEVSIEAARVATHIDHRDPGDCFLIATARVRRLRIVTRDANMLGLARRQPDYLRVIRC